MKMSKLLLYLININKRQDGRDVPHLTHLLYTAHQSRGNIKPTFSRFLRVEFKAPVFHQEYFPSEVPKNPL